MVTSSDLIFKAVDNLFCVIFFPLLKSQSSFISSRMKKNTITDNALFLGQSTLLLIIYLYWLNIEVSGVRESSVAKMGQ